MKFLNQSKGRDEEIVTLFSSTFTASEGPEEGALIGDLVLRLLRETPPSDLRLFMAEEEGRIIASALFSRLIYADDPRSVFLLSPMAVTPARQGRGIGQTLLTHALSALRKAGVDVAITYGDPAFYGKVGFSPLDESFAAPPLPLSQPHGWIGRSLIDGPFHPLRGPSHPVEALNDPAIW